MTGITVHFEIETTLILQLTDDLHYVKSILSVKKSNKFKFVRQPKNDSVQINMASSENQH